VNYKFEYADESLKQRLSDQDAFWDSELEQELQPVLKRLKEFGEPEAGANVGFKPGVSGLVYELQGKTFKLVYTVSSELRIVKFYEFLQMSHSIDWQAALDDLSDDCYEKYEIPQIGDPREFLAAIDCIYQGVITPYDLGLAMGSSATKNIYVARRGYYFSNFLKALHLLETVKSSSKAPCTYKLTTKGELIAKTSDTDTRARLFAEALLGYPPLQMIISLTTKSEKQLTPELIGEVIRQTSKDGCGGKTNPRRAGSLRLLTNWVSRMAGIPICRKGQDGVQLYIPYIYAD